MQILEFLKSLTWQDWVTIGGFTLGTITLIAYIEQRRSSKENSKLAKWASLNLDKTISEEEIKSLITQKSEMEKQITQNIPDLARVAVIKEQVQHHAASISKHFTEWKKLNDELGDESAIEGIDKQIQEAIVELIMPSFEKEQEVSILRTRITVLSVSMAAASALLPFGLGNMLALIIAPALIVSAVRLYSKSEDVSKMYTPIRTWTHIAYWITSLFIGGLGLALLLIGDVNDVARYFAFALCTIGVLLALVYFLLRGKIDSSIKKVLNA